jgi:hypothetical protein
MLMMMLLLLKLLLKLPSPRTLLLKLVEKGLTSKHPQLMLRRTESIVEKMLTNWLVRRRIEEGEERGGEGKRR